MSHSDVALEWFICRFGCRSRSIYKVPCVLFNTNGLEMRSDMSSATTDDEEFRGEGIRGIAGANAKHNFFILNLPCTTKSIIASGEYLSLTRHVYSPESWANKGSKYSPKLSSCSAIWKRRRRRWGDTFGLKLGEQLELVNFVIYGLNPTCFVIIRVQVLVSKIDSGRY